MLQRPPAYVAPLPQSASPSGTSTPIYQAHHGQAQESVGFHDTIDSSVMVSPSYHGSPVGYITPHNERESYFPPTPTYVPLASPVPSSGDSRVPGVTFEIVQQYNSPYSATDVRPAEDALFRRDILPIGTYSHSASPQLTPDYEEIDEETVASTDLAPILTYDVATDMALHNVNQPGQMHLPSRADNTGWLGDRLAGTTEYTLQSGVQGMHELLRSKRVLTGSDNSHRHISPTTSVDYHGFEFRNQQNYQTPNVVFDTTQAHQLDMHDEQNLLEPRYQDSMAIYRSPRRN
jgi:hypothetical protein